MLTDREYAFTDYKWPTSNDLVDPLRRKCSELLRRYHFRSHAQLVYTIRRARNLVVVKDFIEVDHKQKKIKKEFTYTLRLIADGQKLVFASERDKLQIQVCWWEDCLNGDFYAGKFSLCNKHTAEYAAHETENGSLSANWMPTKPKAEYKQDKTWQYPLPSDLQPLERIVNAFTVLCGMHWPKEWMDPLHSITEKQRKILADDLTNSFFVHNDVAISYDCIKGAFLFKDLTAMIQVWQPICTAECCFTLAINKKLHCIEHFEDTELWKSKVRDCVLAMGGIADLDGLDEATRSKIIAEVRSEEQVPISDGAIEYLAIRSGHLCYVDPAAISIHPKRVCLNKGCGNFFRPEHDVCPKCLFQGIYTVAVIEITSSSGCIKYYTHILSHNENIADLNLQSFTRKCIYGIKDSELRKWKGKVVFLKHLAQDEDEAISWKQAIILYMSFEASLLGIRLQIVNKLTTIGSKFWSAFSALAADRDISFFRVDRFKPTAASTKYELVDSEPVLTADDFTKTVYRIKVDELTYIGQLSIRGSTGRTDVRYAVLSAVRANSSAQKLINRHHLKCLPIEELPVDTVAVVTDNKSSVFQPETLFMLAYLIHYQFFECHEQTLVNVNLSTCLLSSSWFEELQIIILKLFKKTIGMKGEKELVFENSMLAQIGVKRG